MCVYSIIKYVYTAMDDESTVSFKLRVAVQQLLEENCAWIHLMIAYSHLLTVVIQLSN